MNIQSNLCSYTINGDFICDNNNNIENFDNSNILPTTIIPSSTLDLTIPSSTLDLTIPSSTLDLTIPSSSGSTIPSTSMTFLSNDKYQNCPLLALQNQCNSNSSYMLLNCPISCNTVETRSDINCEHLVANNNCLTYPKEMINLCPKSCINSVEI